MAYFIREQYHEHFWLPQSLKQNSKLRFAICLDQVTPQPYYGKALQESTDEDIINFMWERSHMEEISSSYSCFIKT